MSYNPSTSVDSSILAWGGTGGQIDNRSYPRYDDGLTTVVAVDTTAARTEITAAGTLRNLRVTRALRVGNAGTDTITYYVRINGVDSALQCTMTDPATQAQDLVNSVSVVAGDLVEIRAAIGDTPQNAVTIISVQLDLT